MSKVKKASQKIAAFGLSVSMIAGVGVTSFAADTTYDAPTSPVSITRNTDHSASWGDSTTEYITATAHRAASPTLGMMGLTATSGFGMINGGAPASLSDAQSSAAIGIWGTTLNTSYDPYYYNYFYNFYASENGLETTDDALLNSSVAASPMQADTNLSYEGGTVSVSLYTRPQLVLGVSSSNGTDTDGYTAQLETINGRSESDEYYQEGDENYSPQLVSYQVTELSDMVATMYRVADAMDEITDATGAVGRYGSGQDIAALYENYMYGIPAYVLSQIEQGNIERKTVAIISAINEDGSYTLSNSGRYYQHTCTVTDNLADELNKTTVSASELQTADVVLLAKNMTSDDLKTYNENYDSSNQLIYYPDAVSTLYGISNNSTENAFGEAFQIAMIYADQGIEGLDPVSVGAYFYKNLYHLTETGVQKAVTVNYASVSLPEGVTTTVNSSYNENVQDLIDAGEQYYIQKTLVNNSTDLSGLTLYSNGWKDAQAKYEEGSVEETISLSDCKVTLSKTSYTYNGKVRKPEVTVTYNGQKVDSSYYTVKYSSNKNAGTAKVTVTGNGTQLSGTKTLTFKITKASQTLTVKKTSKTISYSKLKKKKQTVTAITKVSGAKTSVSYKKTKGSSKITVNAKTGKVKVKKGLKKGSYTIKVKVTAKATTNYKKATKTVSFKITVK